MLSFRYAFLSPLSDLLLHELSLAISFVDIFDQPWNKVRSFKMLWCPPWRCPFWCGSLFFFFSPSWLRHWSFFAWVCATLLLLFRVLHPTRCALLFFWFYSRSPSPVPFQFYDWLFKDLWVKMLFPFIALVAILLLVVFDLLFFSIRYLKALVLFVLVRSKLGLRLLMVQFRGGNVKKSCLR